MLISVFSYGLDSDDKDMLGVFLSRRVYYCIGLSRYSIASFLVH